MPFGAPLLRNDAHSMRMSAHEVIRSGINIS